MHSQKISKFVQQQWKKMTAEEKQVYHVQSNENCANYEREKHEFDVIKFKNRDQEADHVQVLSSVKARREIKNKEKEAKLLAE